VPIEAMSEKTITPCTAGVYGHRVAWRAIRIYKYVECEDAIYRFVEADPW
jgi:hypothetical protein